jgi:cytochrome d ubiquinol oxidase subunit I
MTLDPVLLSRVQWAWVIAWHILLPAFTVGLASYIAVVEGLYLFTGRQIWFRISGFWTRIFAVSFGMGVVSGIIMPFQFGTNWSRFSDATLSSEFFCSAGGWCPPGPIFLPRSWLRSELCCRLSGF